MVWMSKESITLKLMQTLLVTLYLQYLNRHERPSVLKLISVFFLFLKNEKFIFSLKGQKCSKIFTGLKPLLD